MQDHREQYKLVCLKSKPGADYQSSLQDVCIVNLNGEHEEPHNSGSQ